MSPLIKPTDAAYPVVEMPEYVTQYGQDIRTDIAKHVLQGLVANPSYTSSLFVAGFAVTLADELIKALNYRMSISPVAATTGEPELGSEVRWKGWTDLDPNATVSFCLLINAFDHGAIRLWTVGYNIPGEGVVRYMTAPASEFEVVQE